MGRRARKKEVGSIFRYTDTPKELPKTPTYLSAEEANILYEEPPELWKFYSQLSRRRDYTTNIAGQVTRLDDEALKEMMRISKKQGRQPFKPTSAHLKHWIAKLEELGLIVNHGNYVFFFPKAETPHSHEEKRSYLSLTRIEKGVTKFSKGLTSSDANNPSINIDDFASSENEVLLKNKEVLLNLRKVLKKYNLPLTLHYITLKEGKKVIHNLRSKLKSFEILLVARGYDEQHILHKKTIAMLSVWLEKGVTKKEAKIGMKHVDAQFGSPPDKPCYYEKPVLQVKQDFNKSMKNADDRKKTFKAKDKILTTNSNCYIEGCGKPGAFSSSTKAGRWLCNYHHEMKQHRLSLPPKN